MKAIDGWLMLATCAMAVLLGLLGGARWGAGYAAVISLVIALGRKD